MKISKSEMYLKPNVVEERIIILVNVAIKRDTSYFAYFPSP